MAAKGKDYDEGLRRKVVAFTKLYNSYAAAGKFDIEPKDIQTWCQESRGTVLPKMMEKKQKEREAAETQLARMEAGSSRGSAVTTWVLGKSRWHNMEDNVATWVIDRQHRGLPVSRDGIRRYALLWSRSHPAQSQGFLATESWCRKFLRQRSLMLRPGPKGKSEYPEEMSLVVQMEKEKQSQKPVVENMRLLMEKRKIKKPNMDQFVTFSDCSDLEEEIGPEQVDFEISDNDSSYHDEDAEESLDGNQVDNDGTLQEDGVSWTKMRIPDEVAIQEVNPSLELYMETDDGMKVKTEPCEQNSFVESTPEFDPDNSNMDLVLPTPERDCIKENHLNSSVNAGVGSRRFSLDVLQGEGHFTLSQERRRSSPVWGYFSRHCSRPDVAICNYCSAALKTKRGSTSTLARHVLTHMHNRKAPDVSQGTTATPEVDPELTSPVMLVPPLQVTSVRSLQSLPREMEEEAISMSLGVSKEMPPMNVKRFKLITEKVAQMMVKDYQPPTIVQNSGFRDLISELDPKYHLPSVSYFSDVVIPELYKKMLVKRKEEYSAIVLGAKCCSLTVDRWVLGDGGSIQLGITCHHMLEDLTISRQFLTSSRLAGKQSGLDMHHTIVKALEDWGFNTTEMQLYVVTESARELQAAASSTKCPWTVVQCFSHNLQLAVHGATESTIGYSDMLRKVRDVSHHLGTSPTLTRTVQGRQHAKDAPPGDEELACEGWGGSTTGNWIAEYRMIGRLVNQKEEIKAELEGSGSASQLDQEEWELAEAIVDILKPIDEAMKDFCSSTYPPLSMTIPIVYGIEHMLGRVLKEASSGAGSSTPTSSSSSPSKPSNSIPPPPSSPSTVFAKNLLKAVRSRFPSYKTNRTSLMAMVLDPRYRAVILAEQEVNLVTKMLVDEINDMSSSQSSPSPTKTTTSGQRTAADGKPQSKRSSRRSGLSSLLWSAFEEVSREQPAASGRKLALYQVRQYLDESVLSRTCDPLSWWAENREKYDLILPVARKYAAIPATQIKGSQLIGSASDTDVQDRRLFLPKANIEQLVFLHENS